MTTFPVGGGESAHIAFDEDNPRLIYATTINGTLTEYDHREQTHAADQAIPRIRVWPAIKRPEVPNELECARRIVAARPDRVLYYGTQKLLSAADDRGVTWEEISPDLTKRRKVEKQGLNGGPLTRGECRRGVLRHDFLHCRIAA